MANRNSFKEMDYGYEEFRQLFQEGGQDNTVKIGIVGATGQYPEGDASIADVAAFNEFGTDTIPERPFMRQTMEANRRQIVSMMKKLLTKVTSLQMNRITALEVVGQFIQDRMVQTIDQANFAPNSPETVVRKTLGGTKNQPLVDTGQMRSSIRYEVE